MSTIVYALLTSKKRIFLNDENADTNENSAWEKYLKALTALIPAEVVALPTPPV